MMMMMITEHICILSFTKKKKDWTAKNKKCKRKRFNESWEGESWGSESICMAVGFYIYIFIYLYGGEKKKLKEIGDFLKKIFFGSQNRRRFLFKPHFQTCLSVKTSDQNIFKGIIYKKPFFTFTLVQNQISKVRLKIISCFHNKKKITSFYFLVRILYYNIFSSNPLFCTFWNILK